MPVKHPFAQTTEVSTATLGGDAVAGCHKSQAKILRAQRNQITSEHIVQVSRILHQQRFHLINK
jgi:hypothetical protein